ncbi:MAG TPA: bifunctional UDP-sugar hydrolase/5'-nucleotidase [Bacteroidales bacterium]|nr:bifunctional UDP-sugar hydrolase/5'-nucleotidase [Bacteroidales bacterium]
MKRILVFVLAGLLLLPAIPAIAGQPGKTRTVEVILLHVNDMHAKIDNLGKLAYLSDSLKRTHPYVFLVAAGDNFTGNPVVDMAADKGYPMIDLMNRCGFNVSAFGNHEFDLGQPTLQKRIRQARFPFICCNFDASGAVLKQPKPYLILKAGKVHIPLLGILELNENGIPDSNPDNLKGIVFTDGITTAKEYAWLKTKEGTFFGLTHLGVDTDTKLADAIPQLDGIIGGHSHTLLEKPVMENGVMIVQAGSNLRYVGKMTLVFTDGKLTGRSDTLLAMDSLKRSRADLDTLIYHYNHHNKDLERVLAVAEEPVTGNDELGSLMTDAIASELKLDFYFQNNGGIRIHQIPKGNIRVMDVYKVDPFNNQVVVYRMTPEEIKTLIVKAYQRDGSIDLQVAGMKYTVVTDTNGKVVRLVMTDLSGNSLDPSKTYQVGMNSYMAAAYRFDHSDPGKTIYETTEKLLIEYLEQVKNVNYKGVKRAQVSH